MKCVKTEEAIGHVLCHDITEIIPGVRKGVAFKKGHIVTEEDIPVLLSLGKENLYIWEKKEGYLHEDEAAEILRDMCINSGMSAGTPREGKIEIRAESDGLLKIRGDVLKKVNGLGEMMIATRHGNFPVKKGDSIAAMRIIPLVIEKEKMLRAKELCSGKPILEIKPFNLKKAGIVVTGSEVAKGRIEDAFGPVVEKKLAEYGIETIGRRIVTDDGDIIVKAMESFLEDGADMIICTGGMSVDPDDKTPGAIKKFGADIVSYGSPVLPGAMLVTAYYRDGEREIPVLGLPGCVMYSKRTVFDLVLPRVAAGDKIDAESLASYGEGGLCLNCKICRFPDCGYGNNDGGSFSNYHNPFRMFFRKRRGKSGTDHPCGSISYRCVR